MTTTRISRNTTRPFATISKIFKINEIKTIAPSKQLKKSKKYIPYDAKILRQISQKKNIRNAPSIMFIISGFKFSKSDNPSSNIMNRV